MEKENFKVTKTESPTMIVLGIFACWILVSGFIAYFYFLHKLGLVKTIVFILVFTIIYIPRFLIIRKLKKKDNIEVLDDCILINGEGLYFHDIKDFRVRMSKPQVIFFLNGKMILFQEATFCLKLCNEHIEFNVIGSEKIKLLQEFLSQVVK